MMTLECWYWGQASGILWFYVAIGTQEKPGLAAAEKSLTKALGLSRRGAVSLRLPQFCDSLQHAREAWLAATTAPATANSEYRFLDNLA